MFTSHRTKILAVVTAAALTLTACGSDDDADSSAQGGSNSGSGGAVLHDGDGADNGGDGTSDGKDGKDGGKDGSGSQGSDSGDGDAPQVDNPLENGLQIKEQEPVDGEAAGEEDASEINGVLDGFYDRLGNPDTMVSDLTNYMVDNTCSAVIEEAGGREAIQNSYTADAPIGQAGMVASTHSVEDIRVDGDSASAYVTVNANGQEESNTVRLVRENNRWTMCDR